MAASTGSIYLFVLLVSLSLFSAFAQDCPPSFSSLTKWSSVFNSNPSTVVEIENGQHILVDISEITANGIRILPGGSLTFDYKDTSLETPFISVEGELHIGSEDCPMDHSITITLTDGSSSIEMDGRDVGRKVLAVGTGGSVEIHGAKGRGDYLSWTVLEGTANAGDTTLHLRHSVAGNAPGEWKEGDKLVVATTDFSPLQSEEVTITSVVDSNTVQITPSLKYMHFGESTYGVPEQAEVGLLTRNIVIQGAEGGLQGGHFIATGDPNNVHVVAAHFYNMGQDQIGRYPIHFHICGERTHENSQVKYNAIYKSNFRCVTIHGTHGVLIHSNVAFENLGHCYFLEDGVEENNTFSRNLGISTKVKEGGERLGSDSQRSVSTYWITNPNNEFIDNVAVGSDNAGYWFHVRNGPRGVASLLPQYSDVVPRTIPLKLFKGNKASGCENGVIGESTNTDRDDNPPQADATGRGSTAAWSPEDSEGNVVTPVFTNYTAVRIRDRGLWGRLQHVTVEGGMFSNNHESIQLATSGTHPRPSGQLIVDCTFVGLSDNTGNNVEDDYQSYDKKSGRSFPPNFHALVGVKVYDGPYVIEDSSFYNFYSTERRANGAFGGRGYNQWQVATTTRASGLYFHESVINRVMIEDQRGDGGKTTTIRDLDGTISGYIGTITQDYQYYKTSKCESDPSYGVVCPHWYSQIWVLDMDSTKLQENKLVVNRATHEGDNHRDYEFQYNGLYSRKMTWQPVVSPGATYVLRWTNSVSKDISIQLNNAEKGDYVTLAMCFPSGATIKGVTRGFVKYPPGNNDFPSLEDKSASAISKTEYLSDSFNGGEGYYYDSSDSILFVRLKQRNERADPQNYCPEEGCEWVWIESDSNGNAHDCTDAVFNNMDELLASSDPNWIGMELIPRSDAPPQMDNSGNENAGDETSSKEDETFANEDETSATDEETSGKGSGDIGTSIVHASADAYVRGGAFANKNFGKETELLVNYAVMSDFRRSSYIQFDLNDVNIATDNIASVNLFVSIKSMKGRSSISVMAALADNEDWKESRITYNSAPNTKSFATTIANEDIGHVVIDVTDITIATLKKEDKRFTVQLYSIEIQPEYISLYSREAGVEKAPRIAISYDLQRGFNGPSNENENTLDFEKEKGGLSGTTIALVTLSLLSMVVVVVVTLLVIRRRRLRIAMEEARNEVELN